MYPTPKVVRPPSHRWYDEPCLYWLEGCIQNWRNIIRKLIAFEVFCHGCCSNFTFWLVSIRMRHLTGNFVNVIVIAIPRDERVFHLSNKPNEMWKKFSLIGTSSTWFLIGPWFYLCSSRAPVSWYPFQQISTSVMFLGPSTPRSSNKSFTWDMASFTDKSEKNFKKS